MDDDEAAFFTRQKKKPAIDISLKRRRMNGSGDNRAENSIDSSSGSDSDQSVVSDKGTAAVSAKAVSSKRASANNRVADGQNEILSISSEDEGDVAPTGAKRRTLRRIGTDGSRAEVGDRRRSRSRSGSLTPPPQLTPRRRLAGTQLVQSVFKQSLPFLSSPQRTSDPSQDDSEALFEKQMREQAPAESDPSSNGQVVHTDDRRDCEGQPAPQRRRSLSRQVEAIPDDLLEIVIGGIYVDLPESRNIITDIKSWEKQRLFRIRLNTKLSIAKIAFCKEAGMCIIQNDQKVVDRINQDRHAETVLIYRGVRVFDYVTPYSLGIAAGEQPYFEAHTKAGWARLEVDPDLRKQQQTLSSIDAMGRQAQTSKSSSGATGYLHQNGAMGDSSITDSESYIKITLRASDGKELKVRARPSTKVTSIIDGFRKTHAIPASSQVDLYFEGDKLEGILGDTEVESDDILDVRIT